MTEEITFYSDDKGVRITNTRAIFKKTTYAMANITSVSKGYKAPSYKGPLFLILVGIIIVLISCSVRSLQAGILGAAITFFGLLLCGTLKGTHTVKIGSASGETVALESADEKYIQNIVQAMNEAIIKRG